MLVNRALIVVKLNGKMVANALEDPAVIFKLVVVNPANIKILGPPPESGGADAIKSCVGSKEHKPRSQADKENVFKK
jgi:hypothetical protein